MNNKGHIYTAVTEPGISEGNVARRKPNSNSKNELPVSSVDENEAPVSSVDENGSQGTGSTAGKGDRVVIEHGGNIKMKRQVGLPSGIAFIVGSQIGSGIFISPKGVLRGTGSVGASLLVWTGCGVIALLGSLCYAELGTMIPKSGGDYSYLLESLGPIPAFLNVWTNLIMIRPSSNAVISLTFARYVLTPFFDECGPPDVVLKLLASAVIVTVSLVNCYSARLAARVQVIFTVIKVSALVLIVVGGIVMLSQGNTVHLSTGFEGTSTNPSVIALAFYEGLWAYDGWSALNILTEELVRPSVNLPRAMVIGVPLVMVIYLLTNISYLTVLSKEMLLASPAVALSWGDRVLGPASVIIPLAVACSTFGALNGGCFTGGRLCYAAGREGHFPTILSYVHVHQLTPWCSLVFSTIGALIMISLGDIRSLINFVSFTIWLVYGLTFLGLIVMRFTRKDWERPYTVPIVIPVIMMAVSGYLVIAPIVHEPRVEIIYAALFIVGGMIFYIPFVHFKIKVVFMDSLIKWIQLFLQVAPSRYEP